MIEAKNIHHPIIELICFVADLQEACAIFLQEAVDVIALIAGIRAADHGRGTGAALDGIHDELVVETTCTDVITSIIAINAANNLFFIITLRDY